MEDPELKILNVISVMVSGGGGPPFWISWLGTGRPLRGALWTKVFRRCVSGGGSSTLAHLLFSSSAKDRLKCRNGLHWMDILFMYLGISMDSNKQREYCGTKLLILIFSFQEIQDTLRSKFRTNKYWSCLRRFSIYSGSSRLERRYQGNNEKDTFVLHLVEARIDIFRQEYLQFVRWLRIQLQEDKTSEWCTETIYLGRGLTLSIKLRVVHSPCSLVTSRGLRKGSGNGGNLPRQEEVRHSPIGSGIALLRQTFEKVVCGKDDVVGAAISDLRHVQVVLVHTVSVDDTGLTNLLKAKFQIRVVFCLISVDREGGLLLVMHQPWIQEVKVGGTAVGTAEPTILTVRVRKGLKSCDLLDHDGRPFVLSLAANTDNKAGGHKDVEGAMNNWEEYVNQLFSRCLARDSSTSEDQSSEMKVSVRTVIFNVKVKDANYRKQSSQILEYFLPRGIFPLESEQPCVALLLLGLNGGELLFELGEFLLACRGRHGGQQLTIRSVMHCKVIGLDVWKGVMINIYMKTVDENITVQELYCILLYNSYRLPLKGTEGRKRAANNMKMIFDKIMIYIELSK